MVCDGGRGAGEIFIFGSGLILVSVVQNWNQVSYETRNVIFFTPIRYKG